MNSIKGFFLEEKGLSASCDVAKDAKVKRFLLVFVVLKGVMVLHYLCLTCKTGGPQDFIDPGAADW